MTLREEMSAFQQRIRQIHSALEDLEVEADRLPSIPYDSLSRHFAILEEDLEEALKQVQQSRDVLQNIGTRWGKDGFVPAGAGKQGGNIVGKAIAAAQNAIATAQIGTSMIIGLATQATKVVVPPVKDVAIPTLELRDRLSPPNAEEIEKNRQGGKPLEDKSLKDLQSHYEILEDRKHKERSLSNSSKKKKKKS